MDITSFNDAVAAAAAGAAVQDDQLSAARGQAGRSEYGAQAGYKQGYPLLVRFGH